MTVRCRMHMLISALVLGLAASCQQADRREQGGEVAAALPEHAPPVPTSDDVVRQAQIDLETGHPWNATRRLAPMVRAGAKSEASPEAILVAARAAAAWNGWTEVRRVLSEGSWLASRFDGEGLQLLARAALELDSADVARGYAEQALSVRSDAASHAMRLVLLGRALDRLNATDSAAATYARAADVLTVARDWLWLRAAGATSAAGARQQLYGRVRSDVARARIPWTEAQALERFGPAESAAAAYAKLGDVPSAFRLRLAAAAGDDASRAELRAGLLRFIARASGDDLRRALDVLDTAFPTLTVDEQLTVARRAAAMGVPARAVSGFAAVPEKSLGDADVLSWAGALMAMGHSSDAAGRLATHHFSASNAPRAGFLHGRALVRAGSASSAQRVLTIVATKYASTASAADAEYLLADIAVDDGRETAGRDLYRRSCTHQPAGAFSDDACFRAGVVSVALGQPTTAARILDAAMKRFPGSPERSAMLYWSGRAWQQAGNASLARARWRDVAGRNPLSFYAAASARRLGGTPWTPAIRPLPRAGAADTVMRRVATLRRVGMDAEARIELDALENDARSTSASALAAGAALLAHDEPVRAISLGRTVAATTAGDSAHGDARAYQLIYPLLHRDEVLAFSRANGLDPALVAALIRQESSWYPNAVSVAGARGLMQLMPAVGKQIAASRGFPVWDPALLFDPDVNLELGTAHLRAALQEEPNRVRALAAYNAGVSRVARWSRKAGAADPELFIERIPFVETRDYVRLVLRNAEIYRALYDLQ